ncbi:MAG: hypothetical protein ABRQ26_12470 [Syntrophomonadaceae bacterium]
MIISQAQYDLMAGIKLGKRGMDPLFAELIDWIKASFGIKVIYFIHEHQTHPQRCLLLRMFLETMEEVRAIAVDPQNWHLEFKHQNEIAAKFVELVCKHKREGEFNLERIRTIVWNFDDLAREDTYRSAGPEIAEHIKTHYADAPIHLIDCTCSLTVFYDTDEQVAQCQKNGISGRIKADYYYFLKKHDEFDLITPDNMWCTFDSHENVEKNYQGNYYYYFK